MSKYYNYHKHDDYSNIRTPDVAIQFKNYIDRAIEIGHDAVFTTNHGTSTDVFYAYDKCKDNNLKMIFGIEAYIAKDVKEKVRGNHIVLIALNHDGYRSINKINSRANTDGFYYHPRVQLDWLLELNPKDVVVTSACTNSVLKIEGSLELLHEHFGDHFLLEIQSHNEEMQRGWNKKILDIHNKYGIKLIHGNDSHYIYESGVLGKEGRTIFLNSKGMSYGDEDDFMLDYPEYGTILNRYNEQGIIPMKSAKEAIDNTLIFEQAEDLNFKKNIKMPTIYPDLTYEERFGKLKDIVIKQWNKEKVELSKYNLTKKQFDKYTTAIYNEMKVVKETNEEVHTSDYFLFNYEAVKLATEKYGGKLSYSGRGSSVSFYTNYLLNFTKIDRIFAQEDVPIYPSRFISKTRLLETRSIPDIDLNTTGAEPFYKASMDLLGENHVFPMVVFGRLQSKGAFRMLCRAKNIEMSEYNKFAKSIGDVDESELLNDKTFGGIYKESQAFVGLIQTSSIHSCSYLIYDEPIDEEIGLTRSGDNIVCNITSKQSDIWKFLKEDFLQTDDIRILDKVEKLADIETPNIRDLLDKLDDKTWKLYEDGITATLNQTATDYSTNLVMKYKPKNYAELTSFVSAIRPSFSSLLNGYLNRIDYSSGIDELDNLFKITNGYILYQENVMQFLIHLGVEEDEAYSILKRIAKKDETLTDYLNELEESLYDEWCNKGYNKNKFKDAWNVVLNSVGYGLINSPL
jgi:DNA polymerase III alpha subunit